MKVIELLQIGTSLLSVMSENNIMRDDYKYVKAYYEFRNMRRNRMKYRTAISMLAEELDVSTRTLERIFNRLSREI